MVVGESVAESLSIVAIGYTIRVLDCLFGAKVLPSFCYLMCDLWKTVCLLSEICSIRDDLGQRI